MSDVDDSEAARRHKISDELVVGNLLGVTEGFRSFSTLAVAAEAVLSATESARFLRDAKGRGCALTVGFGREPEFAAIPDMGSFSRSRQMTSLNRRILAGFRGSRDSR